MTKVEQRHLLEYRIIEGTMNHRSGRPAAMVKGHFIPLTAVFWKRRSWHLVEGSNSLKDKKRRPMYRKSASDQDNVTEAARGLLLPHQDDAMEGTIDQDDAMEAACGLLLPHQNDAKAVWHKFDYGGLMTPPLVQ